MLVYVCHHDYVAPPEPTIYYTTAAPACELKQYLYGHFDIYTGAPYDIITTADQLTFLRRTLPLGTEAREQPQPPPHAAAI